MESDELEFDYDKVYSLDFSHQNLGLHNVVNILQDLKSDKVIRKLDVSYNISFEEINRPQLAALLLQTFRDLAKSNRALKSINLAGNNLFRNSCHPLNEHLTNYVEEYGNALLQSKITSVDFSDNSILGTKRRMLKGLGKLCKSYLNTKGEVFICQYNGLHSQALKSLASALGSASTLTHLDISNNFGGLDAYGNITVEGVQFLSLQLALTPNLRVLKVAKNHLYDDHYILLCDAIASVPSLNVLDVSGNFCLPNGAEALKTAIESHSYINMPDFGIRELYISNNPLGCHGISLISHALCRNDTIHTLHVSNCQIEDEGMTTLRKALAINHSVHSLDVSNNPASYIITLKTEAEASAVQCLISIRHDPLSFNADDLPEVVYLALAKKLRFLSIDTLRKLHENPSFNEDLSEMAEALHILAPPERKKLIQKTLVKSEGIRSRLEESKVIDKHIQASLLILRLGLRWSEKRKRKKRIEDAINAKALAALALSQDDIDDESSINKLRARSRMLT